MLLWTEGGGPWTLLQPQALGSGHVAGSPCLGLGVGAGPGGQAGVASGAGREQRGREPHVSGSWAFSPVACPPAREEENAQMVRAAAPAQGQVVTIWRMLWGTYSALGAGDMAVDRGCSQPQKGNITGKKPHK